MTEAPSSSRAIIAFVADDSGGASIVEAAVDDLSILAACCVPPGEVSGFAFTHAGSTRLAWPDLGTGVVYDVGNGTGTSGAARLPATGCP